MSNEAQALWYVVHTYSGYENKVAENIERLVEYRGLQSLIFETRIPTEIVVDSQPGTLWAHSSHLPCNTSSCLAQKT